MNDVMRTWLESNQYAVLDNIALLPRRRGQLAPAPVVIESEDGFAYFLTDASEAGWILKKFIAKQEPDRGYTAAIQALVPNVSGFESGFERKLLKSSSVSSVAFCNTEFQAWIDGTVLMPQVVCPTWREVSDSLSDGSLILSTAHRLLLCSRVSEMVQSLESVGVAHRDLSSRNILIDPRNPAAHFVDWDSLYHDTLTMQSNTACGTNGYIAPFVKANGVELVHFTWAERSDRFALAILNIELLAARTGSRRVEDGGLLLQRDLDNRAGPTLVAVRNILGRDFPDAVQLLDQALSASNFSECPSPADWIEFARRKLAARHCPADVA